MEPEPFELGEHLVDASGKSTSFPGSLILPGGGKMRDPGNEVGGKFTIITIFG